MRVWFDLTNSPHVLVLRPLIEALQRDGAEVAVTARDFAQTVALCERFGIDCDVIGRHRGARLGAKAIGLVDRSVALARYAPAAELPGTAEAARTHLAIPMSAALRAQDIDAVVAAIRGAVATAR